MFQCRIENVENDFLTLALVDSEQKNKCAGCRGCGMFKKNIDSTSKIKIKIAEAGKYKAGDIITVAEDSKLYVKAAAMLFMLPVILLIALVSIFDVFWTETFSLLAALAGVLIYYLLIKSKLNFQIYKIIS